MNFEDYLISKKIDSAAFRLADELLWKTWKREYESMHPASFTAQKLFLINPIRRIYTLPFTEPVKKDLPATPVTAAAPSVDAAKTEPTPEVPANKPAAKPTQARPVFKPKPKIN